MLRRYIVTDYPDKNDAGEIGVNAWMKITDTLTGRSYQFPATGEGIVGGAIRELIEELKDER